MELTEYDVHICRVLFNKETHPMGIALYGDRAKEIYKYVCKEITCQDDFFGCREGIFWRMVLFRQPLADFFFDNNLMDFSCFNGFNIACIFVWSPICEKIWDSGKLDPYLYKLNLDEICYIFEEYLVKYKIKASGKIKLM